MSKPFDATTKHLVESHPVDWLRYLGLSVEKARVIDAGLSTVTADADRVLLVEDGDPWLVHLELQASYDRELPERSLLYNVLLRRKHKVPVLSVVILLRSEADGPEMTGSVRYAPPNQAGSLDFRYELVHVWEQPVEDLLRGGFGTLPLAAVANVAQEDLPRVVRRMEQRIDQEASPADAGMLWTATYVLMGLRYPASFSGNLLRGVRAMKESVTYQAIVAEGIEKGIAEGIEKGIAEGIEMGLERGEANAARKILHTLGEKRFGKPDTQIQALLESISSTAVLEGLTGRLLDVENWNDLLAGA